MNSVKIGNRDWAKNNLAIDRFRNNEIIPEAKSAEEWIKFGFSKKPAWCYLNNDPNNGHKYGKLYNWFAVNDERGLAPSGFRISDSDDWNDLVDTFGGRYEAGHKLRASNEFSNDNNASNESGFNGLPGGYRSVHGPFNFNKEFGYWWLVDHFGDEVEGTIPLLNTDVKYSECAFFQCLSARSKEVMRFHHIKMSGLSVRCVRD